MLENQACMEFYSEPLIFQSNCVFRWCGGEVCTARLDGARWASHQRWPQRAFPTSNQLKDWAVSELPTGRGTKYKSAFFDIFHWCWRSWQTNLDQTRRLRRGAVGVVACRPAALGCSYQTEENESRSRVVSVWLMLSTFNIFWWCLLFLMCGGSGSCSGNVLAVGRCITYVPVGAAKSYLNFRCDAPIALK